MRKRIPKTRERIWFETDSGKPETITIETHCPDKWMFIDRETGEAWVYNSREMKFFKP